MARYSKVGALPQIILLLLLIILLLGVGLFWFNVLGIIDARTTFGPVLQQIGLGGSEEIIDPDDVMLMDRLRLRSLQEAVELELLSLDEREAELDQRIAMVEEREQELQERVRELEEREISLNERLQRYDNRRAVLEQNARYLNSMRPAEAVSILQGYDDQLLIETIRVAEEMAQERGETSLVSVWLSSLPPERAADIQRKKTIRPDNQ